MKQKAKTHATLQALAAWLLLNLILFLPVYFLIIPSTGEYIILDQCIYWLRVVSLLVLGGHLGRRLYQKETQEPRPVRSCLAQFLRRRGLAVIGLFATWFFLQRPVEVFFMDICSRMGYAYEVAPAPFMFIFESIAGYASLLSVFCFLISFWAFSPRESLRSRERVGVQMT